MACRGCGKKGRHGSNPGPGRKVSVFGPGVDVKLRYVGGSEELLHFEGPATRKEYTVGGKINLVVADSRDLSMGVSWAPGLLEMTDPAGAKLFEIHVPLKEELEAEAEARARQDEAWKAAEGLALPPEAKSKVKRRKAKPKDGLTDDDKEIIIGAMDAGVP